MDKFTDDVLLDMVNRIRKAHIEDLNKHPLDSVHAFLRNNSTRPQMKRIWGCMDPEQAAGRATHGDAFRMK